MEGTTCDVSAVSYEIFDENGNLVTDSTEPFKFENGILTFSSDSEDYDGKKYFSSLGVTFVVTENPEVA